MGVPAILLCSVWQGNVSCGDCQYGNDHMHKARPSKITTISVGKVTELIATEPKELERHLVCPPGRGNCSGTGQIQLLMLK